MNPTRIRSALVFGMLCMLPLVAMAEGFYIPPHIQNVTEEGVTFIWETAEPGTGVVSFGATGGPMDRTAREEGENTVHRVRITGLDADTEYAYSIEGDGETQQGAVLTAPGDEREIVFVVVGDSRRWGNRWEETGMDEHVKQWDADVYLTMGDLVVDGHQYEQWPEHFGRFQELTKTKWFVTARGNHEGSLVRDTEKDWFAKYHELPGDGEPYAYFDWGNTHFVIISYESTGRESDWTKSARWLDTHLDGVDKAHTVVAHHFPVYCTGYYSTDLSRKEPGERAVEFRKVLDKHNVSLNCSGHTHIYERHYPIRDGKRDDRNGTWYVVNGGDIGGNFPDWWTAVGDDPQTLDRPTYTVFHMNDDRIESRTFAWSKQDARIVQIDYFVDWKDESIPRDILAGMPSLKGAALVTAMEDLGAMLYAPAVESLLAYLENDDVTIRHAAAKSLSLIANEGAAGALLEYVTNDDLTVAAYAARSLEASSPASLANQIAKLAKDTRVSDRVRIHLLGALQLHAAPEIAASTMIDLLKSDKTTGKLRERAAYALGQTASKDDIRQLTRIFQDEETQYTLLTIAWKLNALTKNRIGLSGRGALANSKPGARREFVKRWLE